MLETILHSSYLRNTRKSEFGQIGSEAGQRSADPFGDEHVDSQRAYGAYFN